MTDKIERRTHLRIRARWPIRILSDDGEIKGETRNITVAGMFISCKKPLNLNEIYPVSIELPNRQSIEVTGKVMWANVNGMSDTSHVYGMGFFFVQVSDEHRRILNDLLKAYHDS